MIMRQEEAMSDDEPVSQEDIKRFKEIATTSKQMEHQNSKPV